ncbi:hypothetical protein GCM10023340_08620 [Nocardioides marinquilinus]|uniref:Uncharacterized protein n=1 Tax=Nocardioides marinquilinus TaxID=1210400 RepID=A0ABP9PAD6_9ACTN
MDFEGIAAVIVALAGLLAAVGALVQNRRGRADQNRQQQVTDAALGDKQRLDETQQALDATERRAERAEAGEVRWRDRSDQLEAEMDAMRDRHREEMAQQDGRCRRAWNELYDGFETLRMVVVDEVARAAAGERVAMIRPHPHLTDQVTPLDELAGPSGS